jgi:vacuolar protein sorting-associated protein 13A/C
MVFESVLVDILNRYLRPYVKRLDPSQIKVGVWKGHAHLDKLELKEDLFEEFDIPVRIKNSYIGKLELKIPWKNLTRDPLSVTIDEVYVVVGPNIDTHYDAERDLKRKRKEKEKKIEKFEEAAKKKKKKEKEAKKSKKAKKDKPDTFTEKLVTNLLKNMEVKVRDIHVRYEDSSGAARTLAAGVTLHSLEMKSADENWKPSFVRETATLIYKLLELNCFGVYWNTSTSEMASLPQAQMVEEMREAIARPVLAPPPSIEYLLKPLSANARLRLSLKPGADMNVPQVALGVQLDDILVCLHEAQFKSVLNTVETFDRHAVNVKFLKYRPVGVGVKEDPRQWWRFAISAVTEEEVRRMMEMWSWKHIQQHRKWCRQYTDSYARKLAAKTITSGLQKELDFLEMELDVFNLTICRQLAESKAAVVKRQEEAEAKKEEGGGGGWLGWATGWGTSSTEEEKGEEVAVAMPTEEELQEEKRRMYEAIGYSDNVEVPIYPNEYVAHSVSVNLEKASVRLWNENGTLAHVVTSSVTVRVQNRPSSKNITVQTTVGRLTARGFDCGTSGEGGEGPIIVSSKHNEEASLLDLSVDINPVNSTVSQRLRVKLLPVQITYHADTVDAVISMFKPSKDVHLQRLSAAAASTLEELKTQGRAGLEHAISQRKLLDLDVVLSSPCLVVPESGAITDSSCVLVVDLGQLEIKSDLRSYVPDVRGATDAELDEAFYDHFKLSLKRLQVLVAGPRQDWDSAWSSGTSPLHVLEPTSLELGLKKSLLPNDTRLPNLKVEGELPALTLSVSDKKLKQLLQVVQSLPLPPPSLAQQNMQSSSRYSIPDQPSQLGTDSMVENISETLFIGPAQPESESSDEEGFETASECESDEDGVLHHQTQQTQTAALSTTKLTLHFVVHQVGILFSEHHESSGCDTPRLHLLVTSVTSDLVMRSWDMRLSASIGDLCVVDHYLTGPNGEPGVFLDTQLTDGQKLITFNYSKFDPQAPHYATEFNLTRQTMAASLALLRLKLHSDSLLNLIDISRSITSVLKSADSDRGKEAQESVQDSVEPSVSSSPSSEGAEQQLPEGERQLQLKVSLAGLEVGLCGGDLGEVMSSSITGIEARVDKFQDYLQVEASVADIILLDNEPKVHHKKIIEKMDQEKKVISLKITVFNEPAFVRDPRDLSLSDMDITADVKRLRVMIIFSFLTRVQRFAMQFLHRLKLDQTTIDSAREAASNTASKTAEALRERSSSRVKLNVIIGAPLLVVPYTPPLSLSPPPSSSSSSPPPPALPPRQRAFVANLGELTIRNVFRLASDVAAEKIAGEQGEKGDQSRFLSSSGCPAVVDCMTVTISSVQLSRVMDVEKASSELKVTKSDEIEADGHMMLKPLQFNGKITRLLSGWCTALPAVSVSCKLKRTQMQFSPQDYHDVMCVLQDIKTMNQKEESAVEVAATEGKPEEGKKETAVEEKAVVKVEGKGEGEGSSTGGVTVHVEADVESLELLLCSHVGDVAEIKIKGAAASVDMLNDKVAIKARISGVEVFDCTPGVLYHKIVSVEENRLAVEAWVDYFTNATKGEGAYDTSKCDLSVKLSVNRIRIVALYLFVSRVLNYAQQLHAQKQDHDDVFEPQESQGLDETRAVQKTQGSKPGVPMRIKLDISVEAPEITMPLNSESCDVVVLDLGQFSLRNGFLGLDVGFSKDKSMALYEQHNMELKDLKLYRSVWDGENNKHSDCQRDILKPVSLTVEIHRNLSADWYHGMPTLSIDAKLNPLLVVASGDDIESVCLILRGNLKESCPSDVDTGT